MKTTTHDLFIIDAHIHLGYMANFYMPDPSLARAITMINQCRIQAACASLHIVGLATHDVEYAHSETLKAIQQYPGRFYGYAIYDPNFPQESLASVKESRPGWVYRGENSSCHAQISD